MNHVATVFFFGEENISLLKSTTVAQAKSDSDVVFCLQLLSKTLFCTLHLSLRESIYHLCINPILRIGLKHK